MAFGGLGGLTFLTAWCGLVGVSYNNRGCLSLYSCLLGLLLLLVQVTLAVAFFADDSWKKKLPHDDTGQAAAVRISSRHGNDQVSFTPETARD